MSTSTRPFRFGLQAFSAGSAKEWYDTARQAEELGYDTLFLTDHYFGPGEIASSSGHRPVDVAPISAMMAAAAMTTTLKVGCRVFAVDYHNPVVLAKELATIDLLTDGRLEVGLGAGWVAAEYDGLGIPMDRPGVRIDRLAEYVQLIRAHWSGEPIELNGTHVKVHGFAGRPVLTEPPPIMIGGWIATDPANGRPPGRHREPQLQQRQRHTGLVQRGQRHPRADPGEARVGSGGRG